MKSSARRSFAGDFRVFFLRGLAVLLPSVLTIWIIVYAYRFVDQSIAQPINSVTRSAVIRGVPLVIRGPKDDDLWQQTHYPDWYFVSQAELEAERERRALEKGPRLSDAELKLALRNRALEAWWNEHWYLNAIGIVLAVLLFYLAGRIFGGFVGRKIASRIERFIASIPVLKQVYPYVKQLVDFVFGQTGYDFSHVVLIEYPRKGIWTIGFLTGHSMNDVARAAGLDAIGMVTVFIPSSPTPFTGYTISMPRNEVHELKISVEEALRFTVSGGVLVPESQALRPGLEDSGRVLEASDMLNESQPVARSRPVNPS